ncbi:MAG: hypothetical protein BWY74_02351 [Firmicutes bacterium ADurb.Bin419]|nr:hypothetical protein [Sedimentibacter sp.]OPZ90363.1 MAG: hypothetical protein BWY74_02351 [Firmicutes bacterium ADurb.Bin419]
MEDKTFEMMEKLYVEFTGFRRETMERFDGVDQRFDGIDRRLAFIEQDHGKKLQALFDGYKQHSDQLDRIEEKVSEHEDIIVRKVK